PHRIAVTPPSSDAPMGMRKVLIYGSSRYVFLEDGGEFKLENDPFGECLGEITQNLEENPKLYSTQDFSASYAVGGKIYPLPPYDPDFRVAVLHDGKAYICEKVASIDNTPMDLQEYFKSADLLSLTESIDVYDHFGLSLLKTIKGKKAQAILEGVSLCAPAKLKDEDYGAIGAAQTEGKSFYLHCNLSDGTVFKFYIIPELGIAMVGDGRYQMSEDFQSSSAKIFQGLKQPVQPIN
ncbi:MAG: hypothetical protein RSA20_05985, partial [Oscillospiraceae bacterium]